MTGVNRCAPDAWLCGPARPLPTAPSDFDWPGRKPVHGCNHLVCLACGAEVRSQDGRWLHARYTARPAQLYSTADWSTIDGVEVDPDFRLYSCRCLHQSEFAVTLTFDPVQAMIHEDPTRRVPWTCGGHPPLELPIELGGRAIADAAALAPAIVAAAADPAQAEAVRGLFFQTQHGALDGVVAATLAAAAAGPAPFAPALQALFESEPRLAPLTTFAAELGRSPPTKAQAARARRGQLLDVLAAAILASSEGCPPHALARLRAEALHGVTPPQHLRVFEYVDRDWLLAHAPKLLAKNRARAGAILARVGRAMLFGATEPAATLRELAALAAKTGVPADTLAAQAEAELGVLIVDSREVVAAIAGCDDGDGP